MMMATNYASASYQEIIDLHTESDRISIIGIHTPSTMTPVHMLKGFWSQFKKFRYNGCSLSLVPAAQLPADPLQVAVESGDPAIDPRDLLNPILFKGCHGDDLGAILNALYTSTSGNSEIARAFADSVDMNVFSSQQIGNEIYESLYYRALTDKTWGKAHPQRGFRKNGLHPLVYMLGTTHQIGTVPRPEGQPVGPFVRETDSYGNVESSAGNSSKQGTLGVTTSSSTALNIAPGEGLPSYTPGASFSLANNTSNIGFYTPKLARLGWMETKQVLGNQIQTVALDGSSNDRLYIDSAYAARDANFVTVPRLFMGIIMLPPAYRTEQYFRLILNHSFSFRQFRGISGTELGDVANGFTLAPSGVPNVQNFNATFASSKEGEKDGSE